MFDLTALMIVRDGETRIENALKSIRNVVQQIVVVDTGSVDKTPIIASRFGAEVHFLEWENDFSKARNYGLQFVRSGWVLVIDYDEELKVKTLEENFHLTNDPKVGGLRVKIVNHLYRGDSYTRTYHTYTRIFRNSPKIRFEGHIHEQIAQSIIDAGFEIVESGITIDHYGYSTINIDKVNRNRKMLEEALEKNPDDDWLLFNLAEAEFSLGSLDKAFSIYYRLKESILLNLEQIEMVKIRLGQIALKRDRYDDVYDYTNFVSSDQHREGLRLMVLGTAYLMQKRYSEAKEIFSKPEIHFSDMIDKNQIQNALEVISLMSDKV
ncbi:MAG: glycosyltransferase [Ignavibacteria bacterium]|nr:glycosyltransferase [Ignavibacteria bacterium]